MGDLARLNDLRRDEPHAVGWDRESYPVGGRIEFGVNSTERRDPHQVALQIHQRTTTVARVNRSIGLDRVRNDSPALSFGDGTSQSAHDAMSHGESQPKRISESHRELSGNQSL